MDTIETKQSFFSFKNKTFIMLIVVLGILIPAGGYFVLGKQSKKIQVTQTTSREQSGDVVMLPQDALDVKLDTKGNNQYTLTIDKIPTDVAKMTYQVTYATADNAQRGFGGSDIQIKAGQAKYTNNKIIFGTCSSGKCVYDKGVHDVTLDVRFTYNDGSEKGWTGILQI